MTLAPRRKLLYYALGLLAMGALFGTAALIKRYPWLLSADGREKARIRKDLEDLVRIESVSADPARAKEIEAEVIDVFMTEFPYIALQYAPNRLIYRTENAVGWPSDENPYPVDQLIRIAPELRPPGDAAASTSSEEG